MTTKNQKKTHSFQTEVTQLLHLMVHSLYSNKEIFLRELISNSADACDKLRFKAVSDADLYEGDADLKIRISTDKEKGTLTISDNGIGMTEEEVIQNLGTIARSGTAEFLKQMSGEQKSDSQLIGQFGVGFYSSFIVAEKVTVLTRGAGTKEGVCWESTGDGSFTIEPVEKAQRGTSITLHLKEEEKEFSEDYRVRNIISKYSDHISVAVEMLKVETPELDEDGKPKEVAEKAPEWEVVNKAKALWTEPKSELKDEDYAEFYKHIAHDFADPLTWAHNHVEGKMEYTSLLYIPAKAPFDLWQRDRAQGLKLYVQRVFIMDDAEQFLPSYLRFVKGVLDSNDIPLNVSREILQDNSVTQSLRSAVTKRVLDTLKKLAKNDPEKYQIFWNEFGAVLKEGPAEDFANKEAIANLLRFASTEKDDQQQVVSFEDYVSRMKQGQKDIYYITAESFQAAKTSPHLEIFRKKGIEVLLLTERVDEWLVSHLTEFGDKKLVSVTRGELDLGELEDKQDKEKLDKENQQAKPFLERMNKVLEEKVKEIRLTHRLTDTPACIVQDEGDLGPQMAQILKAAGQAVPDSKPILELNPEHLFVKKLEQEQDEEDFSEWANLLLEQAILAERGQLDDPMTFTTRLNRMLLKLSN
jgi:molecular chaperone HtpG